MSQYQNLVPLIEGQAAAVRKPDESVGFELGGNIALFQGDYKLIRNRDPIGDNVWHLFNIVEDPAESRDLADMEPGRLAEMIAAYRDYEVEYGVLPVPEGYDQRRQVAVNALTKRVQRLPVTFILAPILLFVIIPGLLFIYFRRLKRK